MGCFKEFVNPINGQSQIIQGINHLPNPPVWQYFNCWTSVVINPRLQFRKISMLKDVLMLRLKLTHLCKACVFWLHVSVLSFTGIFSQIMARHDILAVVCVNTPDRCRGCSCILQLLAFCCTLKPSQIMFSRTPNHTALKQTTMFSYRVLENPRLWEERHNTLKEHSNHFVNSSSLATITVSKVRELKT